MFRYPKINEKERNDTLLLTAGACHPSRIWANGHPISKLKSTLTKADWAVWFLTRFPLLQYARFDFGITLLLYFLNRFNYSEEVKYLGAWTISLLLRARTLSLSSENLALSSEAKEELLAVCKELSFVSGLRAPSGKFLPEREFCRIAYSFVDAIVRREDENVFYGLYVMILAHYVDRTKDTNRSLSRRRREAEAVILRLVKQAVPESLARAALLDFHQYRTLWEQRFRSY